MRFFSFLLVARAVEVEVGGGRVHAHAASSEWRAGTAEISTGLALRVSVKVTPSPAPIGSRKVAGRRCGASPPRQQKKRKGRTLAVARLPRNGLPRFPPQLTAFATTDGRDACGRVVGEEEGGGLTAGRAAAAMVWWCGDVAGREKREEREKVEVAALSPRPRSLWLPPTFLVFLSLLARPDFFTMVRAWAPPAVHACAPACLPAASMLMPRGLHPWHQRTPALRCALLPIKKNTHPIFFFFAHSPAPHPPHHPLPSLPVPHHPPAAAHPAEIFPHVLRVPVCAQSHRR